VLPIWPGRHRAPGIGEVLPACLTGWAARRGPRFTNPEPVSGRRRRVLRFADHRERDRHPLALS